MRLLTIDTASETPIYVQFVEQVRARIDAGELPVDASLPPVRRLAADLELNPNTVAKAYLLLECNGLIRTRPRRGCFVAARSRDDDRDAQARRAERFLQEALGEGTRREMREQDLLEALRRRLSDAAASPSQGRKS